MVSVLETTEEELRYLISTTHALTDEAVLDRIRSMVRVVWGHQKLSVPELDKLHRYSRALQEEALKRMRG